MDIIFQGKHSSEEAAERLASILRLFHERYHIDAVREMHLTITLLDEQGEDVELIDSETLEAYRTFEVYRSGCELKNTSKRSPLTLVVDNSHKKDESKK